MSTSSSSSSSSVWRSWSTSSSHSSSSNSSVSSSSSSIDNAYYVLGFKFSGHEDKSITCLAERNNAVYMGSMNSGTILYSTDNYTWNSFADTGDHQVRALAMWRNGLFAGTGPGGTVFTHNFTSGEEYIHVVTKDTVVSAFCEHNGKLYVGTKPEGYVYSFNGNSWKEEHRVYGGVNKMVSFGGNLVVLGDNMETPIVFTGQSWSPMPIEGTAKRETVASTRKAIGLPYNHQTLDIADPNSNETAVEAIPMRPEHNLHDAVAMGTALFIVGSTGSVYRYEGGVLTIAFQSAESGIARIAKINESTLIVSVSDKLFLVEV